MKTALDKLNEALEPDPLLEYIQEKTGIKSFFEALKTSKGDPLDPEEYEDERLIGLNEQMKAEIKEPDDDMKLEGEAADRYQIKHC